MSKYIDQRRWLASHRRESTIPSHRHPSHRSIYSRCLRFRSGSLLCSAHIPYRDSKLTRLLQDSLGGNAFTCMVGDGLPRYNVTMMVMFAGRTCHRTGAPCTASASIDRPLTLHPMPPIPTIPQFCSCLIPGAGVLRISSLSELRRITGLAALRRTGQEGKERGPHQRRPSRCPNRSPDGGE